MQLRDYQTDIIKRTHHSMHTHKRPLIVTADHLATDWIFQDDTNVTTQEIRQFLLTKSEVSANLRGYQYMCEWVAQNAVKFNDDSSGDRYGFIQNDTAYIIANVFHRAAEEAGFSPAALLSWMKGKGLIETNDGRRTVLRRVCGIATRCIAMSLNDNKEQDLFPM